MSGSDTADYITCQRRPLALYFSSHKQSAHSLLRLIDFSTTCNSNSNPRRPSSHPTHNKSNSIMASKVTNAAGLTAREVDILCAMCQSLKSKPEVSPINQSSLPSLCPNYSLTLAIRPTWRTSLPSPASPRRAVLPPISARS